MVSTPAVWPHSGWPGCATAPGAERLEVVELEAVAGQVELEVERQAGVAHGEDEAVATDPAGVAGVVAQMALEEQVGGRGQAHGGAGVAVAHPLDGVHRQDPARVDGASSRSVQTRGLGAGGTRRPGHVTASFTGALARERVVGNAGCATWVAAYRDRVRDDLGSPTGTDHCRASDRPAPPWTPDQQTRPDQRAEVDVTVVDAGSTVGAVATLGAPRDREHVARCRSTVGAYVALTKPRIIELLLVTTVPTMFLAADGVPSLHARAGHLRRWQLWPPARPTASTASSTVTSTR